MRAALAELRETREATEQCAAAEVAARHAAEAAAASVREAAARRLRGGDLPPLAAYELREIAAFIKERDDERARLALEVRSLALRLESRSEPDPPPADATPMVRALERDLAMLRAQHDLVLRSTVWRVGSRLTAAARRRPVLAREARRALKLGWWIVSGRFGERLRTRRAMHEAIEQLRVSKLFDADYYLSRHAAVVPPGTDALMHYLWVGAASGLDPHPLFDTSWYASQMPAGSTMNPLAHYISGAAAIDPHPLFEQAHDPAPSAMGGTALERYLAADDFELAQRDV